MHLKHSKSVQLVENIENTSIRIQCLSEVQIATCPYIKRLVSIPLDDIIMSHNLTCVMYQIHNPFTTKSF